METNQSDPVSAVKEYVEEVFSLLQEESGFKPVSEDAVLHNRLENLMDPQVCNPRIGAVHVDVELAREKDQKLPHRVELANQVRDVVEEKLLGQVTPGGRLSLYVRVLLVSDGTSGASRRFNSGVGSAKVTLAYCLLDNGNSQQVALANAVYHTKDCQGLDLDNYWELSSAVVRSLADQASQHIISQITFHLHQWKTHCKENQERLEKIEAKLAQEDNLDAAEYAFASEKNIL